MVLNFTKSKLFHYLLLCFRRLLVLMGQGQNFAIFHFAVPQWRRGRHLYPPILDSWLPLRNCYATWNSLDANPWQFSAMYSVGFSAAHGKVVSHWYNSSCSWKRWRVDVGFAFVFRIGYNLLQGLLFVAGILFYYVWINVRTDFNLEKSLIYT